MYHLACLEAPFIGDNLISLGYNIVHKTPKQLSPIYTPKLSTLIMKFLEKNPNNRPKISDILDYFPYQGKSAKESREIIWPALTNSNALKNDKIEIFQVDSAKLFNGLVEDNKVKYKEDEKQVKNENNILVNVQNYIPNSNCSNLNQGLKLKDEQVPRIVDKKENKIVIESQKQNDINTIVKAIKSEQNRESTNTNENSLLKKNKDFYAQDIKLVTQVI